ncbi:MAG: PQQ-binding-like beta-propeller repeat protein [Planctomycetaceae bacterium]
MSVCSGLRLPIRQPRVFLLLACWSFEILNPRARIVAAEPVRPIRESLTLPVDGQITKTLLSVDEYLSDARFAELTELLTNLAETHSQDLVPVSRGVDRDVNRYQNVAIHCQAILAAFPPEGLAASRKLLDPAARRWYEAWKASRDESHLERILRSAYTSSYGDNALWELGELAWDRGDFELAASSWRQLMPREDRSNSEGLSYPDPEFPAAEVKARLILCDLWERNPRAAARKLREFRAHYPQETGKLAGGEGRLVDILDEITTQSVTWDARQLKPGANTFGGSFSRQHHWPESLDVGPLQWSARWPVRNLPTLSKNPLADAGPLRSMPVVDGDRVFLCDGDTVRGWRVLTGQPAWPNDQADPSVVYPQNVTNLAGWDNEPGDLADDASLDGRVPLPDRPCVGVPWQTLTIRDGKLFARLGSPVVGPARTELRDLSQEIICLDIGQGQGKLVWKLTNQDVPTGGPPWSFEGTPLVIDDAAFVVVYRRQPEPEFALLSLEAASGSVRWLRSIGAARPSLEDAVNRVSHLLLTAGAGRLYLSTDQGTIVSLSPQQGDLLWAVAYDSEPRAVHRSAPDHLQTGLLPPMSWQGMLFVAPNDSRRLYCLDGATGRVRWQRESPERIRQLVGIAPGDENHRLIVAGNSLHSFDAETGEPGWRITQTDAARQGYGQAVLSGKSLFWPTREMLFQIDPATGELQREIVLRISDSPRSGGNLGVADGVLLVVEPNGISAYGEYGVRRERLQIDLSQHPSDPHFWRQLMELECGERNWQAAIAAGRRAWSLAAQLPPAVAQETLQDWTGTLHFIAKRQTDAGEFDAVQACYEELSALPLSPSDQARLLWVWSRLDRRRGDIATAVARLHQLLTLDAARSLAFKNKSLDDAVREQLEILMNEHGREAFQEVDARRGTIAGRTGCGRRGGGPANTPRVPVSGGVDSALVAND